MHYFPENRKAHTCLYKEKFPCVLIIFLNGTNKNQTSYIGMVALIKVGYKIMMLSTLLEVFDEEGIYKEQSKKRKTCVLNLRAWSMAENQ